MPIIFIDVLINHVTCVRRGQNIQTWTYTALSLHISMVQFLQILTIHVKYFHSDHFFCTYFPLLIQYNNTHRPYNYFTPRTKHSWVAMFTRLFLRLRLRGFSSAELQSWILNELAWLRHFFKIRNSLNTIRCRIIIQSVHKMFDNRCTSFKISDLWMNYARRVINHHARSMKSCFKREDELLRNVWILRISINNTHLQWMRS